MDEWREACRHDPQARSRFWRALEEALDAGHGARHLADPMASRAVVRSLLQAHGGTCRLHAFVVMPNHCHVLATVSPRVALGEFVRRIKGASARAVILALGRGGRLWQDDSFDRVVRSDAQFRRTAEHVEWNPVKAGLCTVPERFYASSADPWIRRRLEDGCEGRTEVRPPEAGSSPPSLGGEGSWPD